MDRETELVKSENWSELRRFYSAKAGHSWELAWIHFLKIRDRGKAAEEFAKTFQDPRFEEASHILLWKLGKKPGFRRTNGPPSLRLYEAFLSGNSGSLLDFIEASDANAKFAPALIRQICELASSEDLESFSELQLPASLNYLLGRHAERHLKNPRLAALFLTKFLEDPWSARIVDEVRRLIFDPEISQRLRHAYSRRDGITVKRILKTAHFRLEKMKEKSLSAVWSESLDEALEQESTHITETLFGFSFWNTYELSPSAIHSMRSRLFSEDSFEEPTFVTAWRKFFESEGIESLPFDLDPESLSLWQIRVELDESALSEALLRFPMEERFLFLWSLRHRQNSASSQLDKKWPTGEQESDVVRKNLERAFDRSSNKVLWFDRLRQVGCSQSFYEYAIERSAVPLEWILEDLQSGQIKNTEGIRQRLRHQLSLSGPTESKSHELKTSQIKEALGFLTPAEAQAVLLSRFVLSQLPEEILNDDYLDLLWEARARVSQDTFVRWKKEVGSFLSRKKNFQLQRRHWRWIEALWEDDESSLEVFSPQINSGEDFPWETYLDRLQSSGKEGLLLTCIHRIPDERLKESWARQFLATGPLDHRLYAAIGSLATDYIRHSLLAIWYQEKGEIEKAIQHRHEELQLTPILNEQTRIAREILGLHQRTAGLNESKSIQSVLELAKFLENSGGLDSDICGEVANLLERNRECFLAWKFIIQKWIRSPEAVQETLLPRVLDLALRGKAVEETQRFLVDQIFKFSSPGRLSLDILNALMGEVSPVRLRHLRPEFIEQASKLYPLHRELLKERSKSDYRAVLLWDAFYGESLDALAVIPSHPKKRDYKLWKMTDSVSQADLFAQFGKYIESLPVEKSESEPHEFFEKSERIAQRFSKQFGVKKSPKVLIKSDMEYPLRFYFHPATIGVRKDFFDLLDEETWAAVVVGFLQMLEDRDQGLFEEKRLIERFFQGMLLSGASVQKMLRLWVWIAMHEGLVEAQILRSDPQELIQRLPFLNSLLIFFLSPAFEEKSLESAFVPS